MEEGKIDHHGREVEAWAVKSDSVENNNNGEGKNEPRMDVDSVVMDEKKNENRVINGWQ